MGTVTSKIPLIDAKEHQRQAMEARASREGTSGEWQLRCIAASLRAARESGDFTIAWGEELTPLAREELLEAGYVLREASDGSTVIVA